MNISKITNEKNSEMVIDCKNVGIKFSKMKPSSTLADLWDLAFTKNKTKNYFWALKDITFSIGKGELIGLIGKNGSGKSTLLRVIGGILKPDQGSIKINTTPNLVAPGIGQREQLSGRENIILGCLYLGHSMKEIKQNFDQMVKFAELEEHIERPIRYYSSGMLSRLLFTIATSIKPEFLLLDELLSAGDISFRNKANKRMREIVSNSKGGVIATHDLAFVKEYCTKSLYLQNGELKFYGSSDIGVDMYTKDALS